MNKIQINFIDAIPLNGKISIKEEDKNSKELFIGDTVIDEKEETYVIGYRYGEVCLIPPQGMHTLMVKNYSSYSKTNQVIVIMGKYLIIGYNNEKFFEINKEELSKIEFTRVIPQD